MKYILLSFLIISLKIETNAQDFLIPYRKDTLWGYANDEGKIILAPQFSKTELFGKRKYTFPQKKISRNKGLFGIVKNDGQLISEAKYKYIITLSDRDYYNSENPASNDAEYQKYLRQTGWQDILSNNYFMVRSDTEKDIYQLIDSNANIVFEGFQDIRIANYYGEGYFNFYFSRDKKTGLSNYRGQVLLQPVYDQLHYTVKKNAIDYIVATKNKTNGLITLSGKNIIPFGDYEIQEYTTQTKINQVLFKVRKKYSGESAIYNAAGKKLVDFTDKDIIPEVIQKNGKEILNFSLSGAEDQNSITTTAVEDKWSRDEPKDMDAGPAIAPAEDNSYTVNTRNINGKELAIFRRGNLFGLMNRKDSAIIIKPKYDSLYWCLFNSLFSDDRRQFLCVKKDENFGVIAPGNDFAIPLKYKKITELQTFSFTHPKRAYFIAINKKNKTGLLNEKNETIIPFEYDYIQFENTGGDDSTYNFRVKNKNGNIGILNNYNQTLLPENYSELTGINDDIVYNGVRQNKQHYIAKVANGKYGVITQDNKEFLPFVYDSIIKVNTLRDNNNRFIQSYFTVIYRGKYGILNKKGEYLFKPTFDQTIELLNYKINDSAYYAVSTLNKKEYNLFSNKTGLLISADKSYSFGEKSYKNDYNNGVIFFKDNKTRLYGALLINKNNEIIKPVYDDIETDNFINEYPKSKRLHVVYYSLKKYEKNTQDIFTNTGLKFFED
jgi:hypothetical protein